MLPGIKYNRTATGKATSVTINLKQHGEALEDFLDSAEIARHRNEPAEPLEKVLTRLDKKHGIKRIK